jgi:mannonate dehydratase
MPVLDWTRTDLDYELPDGATALRFEFVAYAAFDLFILKREGAEADYSQNDVAAAEAWLDQRTNEDKDRLVRTIIAGLPGSEESYTLDTFREHLAAYRAIDKASLFQNLANFLEIVVPVAEEEGVKLAIHPDDPPRSLFGLPRIVGTLEDLIRIKSLNTSQANGFTVCSGSLGVHPDNDLPAIIDALATGSISHICGPQNAKRTRAVFMKMPIWRATSTWSPATRPYWLSLASSSA